MNVCNIVYDAKQVSIEKLQSLYGSFVNFSDLKLPTNTLPTLFYGYKTANTLYGKVIPKRYRLAGGVFWSYTEEELAEECWITKFITECFNKAFAFERIDLDVIFNPASILTLLKSLENSPNHILLNNGKYELYICELKTIPKIWSIKKDNLKYAGINADELLWTLIQKTSGRCFMFSVDEIDILKMCDKYPADNIPVFIQELLYIDSRLSIDSILDIYRTYSKLSKEQLLLYIINLIYKYNLESIIYYLDNYNLLSISTTFYGSLLTLSIEPGGSLHNSSENNREYFQLYQTYSRNLRSALSEKIYEAAPMYFDKSMLSVHLNAADGQEYKKLNNVFTELDSKNRLYSTYHSRDIATYRLFSKHSTINWITEADPSILSSVVSNYDQGLFCCIDYAAFEFSIIKQLLKLDIDQDIHSVTAKLLGCPRSTAKKINNAILYGASSKKMSELLNSFNSVDEYLTYIGPVIAAIRDYKRELQTQYDENGYVTNIVGHRVYSKSKFALFNNVIQSTGSEILNDSTIGISNTLDKKDGRIIFQRFDSIYFDLNEKNAINTMKELISYLTTPWNGLSFDVSVKIGRRLTNLKAVEWQKVFY